jgi:hypothetical protein
MVSLLSAGTEPGMQRMGKQLARDTWTLHVGGSVPSLGRHWGRQLLRD